MRNTDIHILSENMTYCSLHAFLQNTWKMSNETYIRAHKKHQKHCPTNAPNAPAKQTAKPIDHIRNYWFALHSETPPGKNQNIFARRTVCTYVWIVPDWTLKQSMAKSTERQVLQIAYQGKLWVSPTYETSRTRRSVLLAILCCKVQSGTIHT